MLIQADRLVKRSADYILDAADTLVTNRVGQVALTVMAVAAPAIAIRKVQRAAQQAKFTVVSLPLVRQELEGLINSLNEVKGDPAKSGKLRQQLEERIAQINKVVEGQATFSVREPTMSDKGPHKKGEPVYRLREVGPSWYDSKALADLRQDLGSIGKALEKDWLFGSFYKAGKAGWRRGKQLSALKAVVVELNKASRQGDSTLARAKLQEAQAKLQQVNSIPGGRLVFRLTTHTESYRSVFHPFGVQYNTYAVEEESVTT